ncbi:unnamed protein product, partial [Ascophyllum nodosum]
QDGTPLCDYLVDDILRLRDLLDRAYATPAGAEWVREALSQAAASRRPVRTTSFGNDTSSSAGPRRCDEPSSGRRNSKRASLTETSATTANHGIKDATPRTGNAKLRLRWASCVQDLTHGPCCYFARAPRGAALETLQKFGVRT